MNRLVTFALAVMLAIFNGYAQQPPSAFTFRPVLRPGMTIGGHTLTHDTIIEGLTLSDTGEVAFIAHWNESRREHSGVFTSTRLVAEDGNIDGKYVIKVLATSLSINASGQVGYEAVYVDGPNSHTGVFVDRKFIVTLSTAGANNDFALNADGKITLIAAVAASATAPAAPKKQKAWLPPGIGARLPQIIDKTINKNSNLPIWIDPNIPAQRGKAPSPPRPQAAPLTKAAATPARACAVPEWPIPSAWHVGDEMIGPIAGHLFEAPVKNRFYEALVFDRMITPFRIIQCSAEGKPLIITVGDNSQPGHFEIHTPNGLLTYTKDDGFLDLGAFPGNVLPGLVVRADTPLRVNRHGQVLLPVTFEDRYAILLATPIGGPR
jgi:hypothetical protein